MKKIFIIIAMLFTFNVAKSNEITINNKITTELLTNNKKNYIFSEEQLGKNIISLDKKEKIYQIYRKFSNNMYSAGKIGNKEMERSMIFQSISDIIGEMRENLDKDEYREFIQSFNILLLNHGFSEECRLYCLI